MKKPAATEIGNDGPQHPDRTPKTGDHLDPKLSSLLDHLLDRLADAQHRGDDRLAQLYGELVVVVERRIPEPVE